MATKRVHHQRETLVDDGQNDRGPDDNCIAGRERDSVGQVRRCWHSYNIIYHFIAIKYRYCNCNVNPFVVGRVIG